MKRLKSEQIQHLAGFSAMHFSLKTETSFNKIE